MKPRVFSPAIVRSLLESIRWRMKFRAWKKVALAEELLPVAHPDTLAVVVSSQYPEHIDVIVSVLERTPSVEKVIVFDKGPPLAPRPLHLLYVLLEQETGYEKFLVVDDDLFLKPSQLEAVCRALQSDPVRPHGIEGIFYDAWRGAVYHHQRGYTQFVDALCRVRCFTASHLVAFRELMREAGFGPLNPAWTQPYGDDLFLSYAAGTPKILDVGDILDCPLRGFGDMERSVARLRLPILLMLRKMRPRRA